ncbi:hypothetical protein PPYR_07126 [Photinus pyralis]|uniref:ATP-dependent DNA helicase n=4 Tax=Photinus pyralis TaxID=7054 RepID=A0A5N4APM2_PHOPY|nr:hypothetical protein PPYR_07126 [Photinus pyralis]
MNITPLEERCVAARIPFMKLVALGCDRQIGIKSGVVNVPIDVRRTIESIPARPEDSGIIELSLVRKMCYRSVYMKERVRPAIIWKAAKMLTETPLYIGEGIGLNPKYESNDVNAPTINLDETNAEIVVPNSKQDGTNILLETDTEFVPAEDNYIEEETLLDSNEGIQFAPGEGQIPIPMFMDPYCEELAFPTIYFGHPRKPQHSGIRLSYEDIVKSELQRYDRRACRADHLLFMHKKSQIKQLMGQMNIVFRKSAQTHEITASQVTNKQYIEQSIFDDHAYKFTASITGSPAYWEQQKKKVLAMVRQYGIFTIFLTLSSAETHWKELLVILKKTVDKEEISEDEAGQLTFDEKARLIRTDPVTCALYFDHRFKELRKTWHGVEDGPFGHYVIEHYFYRIEFQHRGSPHVHMVLWLKDAPIFMPYDEESERKVAELIDMVSTTDTNDPDVQDFIKNQWHRCSQTCKKTARGKISCRFGAPFRPMDKTRILYPIDQNLDKAVQTKIRELNGRLNEILDDTPEEIGTLHDLMIKSNCSFEEYLLAARTSLKHPTIFIKREPKNTRINVYNKKIILCMRSNMDIQYVLDPYSCIGYIVDYVNKSSRGLSRLLRECIDQAKRGNYTLKEKLKSLAHIMYNSSEICAQEAAWCRLHLAMARCSDGVEFINTNHSSTRTRILKSNKELQDLVAKDPESTDIYKKGTIEHYENRPDELESLCLAEFVANFTFKLKAGVAVVENENNDNDIEAIPTIDDESVTRKLRKFQLRDGTGTITERKSPKVIRYCRFNMEQDEENALREMCLLFRPFRDEKSEIEDADCALVYINNRETISENYTKFNAIELDLTDILREIEDERRATEEEAETNAADNPDENPDFLNVYEFDDNVIRPDLETEIGELSRHELTTKYVVPELLSDDQYLNLCDSLNIEQRDYLMHLISVFKDGKDLPVYHFITGGAGVGKSRLISAIYQSIIKIFRMSPGQTKENEVLLVAFTGMAAHNIGGVTAHAAFCLVPTIGDAEKMLPPDKANSMAASLQHLKLIIIDEISMLPAELLNQISSRLKQTRRTTAEFGSVSVIAVGDFNQLAPVGGAMPFKPRNSRQGSSVSILVDNPQWSLFQYYKLPRVMRQRDDLRFAQALNRIPTGECTAEDIQLFESRSFMENTLPVEAKAAVRLMKANRTVDEFNIRRIREIEKDSSVKIIHQAEDRFSGHITERQKNQARREIEKLNKKDTQNLMTELQLVYGVKYMISTNIDVTDGLFNGATGTLRFIEIVNNRTQAVYLQMDDKSVGKSAIGKRRAFMEKNNISTRWTPIFKTKKTFNVLRKGTVQVTREQYPLVPAEGITVHKSQGQSMPKVVIDLISSKMDRAMLYVALSRAISLDGLFLIGKFVPPAKLDDNNEVKLEMARMERDCTLVPAYKFLREVKEDFIQIISHNVQSIQKHSSSIVPDETYMNSAMILLQETWAVNNRLYDIPTFTEICRNDFAGPIAKAQGTMIYVKDSHLSSIVPACAREFKRDKQHIEVTSCIIREQILIINIYKNPDADTNLFKDAITAYLDLINSFTNIFLLGDFNENLAEEARTERFLKTIGFKLVSQRKSTTNTGTTIDGIFAKSNLDIQTYIYESYFSYHKALILRFNY